MPNFVLLMSDSHNPRISSVYGHPFVKTPNLDRLAQMGTVYENSYCGSPLCVPSRSSFMAGRYAHEIDVYNNCKVIPAAHPSYGGVLADQGVHTTYIGAASNLYRNPFDLGFKEMQRVVRTQASLSKNFARSPLPVRGPGSLNRRYGPRPDVWTNDIASVDRSIEWLRETAPTLESPWTLTVNVEPPHSPLTCRPEFWEMYAGYDDLPLFGIEQESAQHPYAQDLRNHFYTQEASEADIRNMRRGYYACVSFVDRELGRLLDALEANDQLKDTVIVYTTDHGEMLGKFGMWWKHSLYEDSVRVPLVAAGPGFGVGQRVATPVQLLDLQAAIFKAVGKARPTDWRGEALQDIPQNDPNRVVFAEYHGNGVRSGAFMIRRGDWKLMFNMAAPHQLFNLKEDPEELCNLWDKEPEIARSLERELRTICDPEAVNARAHAFEKRQLEVISQLESK